MFVVATISKNSYTAGKIEEILRAGADVLRFNFSHGTPSEMREKVAVAHEVINRLGLMGKVKILADLPGEKLRLGKFVNTEKGEYPVKKGQKVILRTAKEGDPTVAVPVDVPSIKGLVRVGDVIYVGDGEIALQATAVLDDNSFEAVGLNDRYLPEMKAIHIGGSIDSREHLTAQTLEHLQSLLEIKPDWVAFSFVNSGAYLDRARALLDQYSTNEWKPLLMSKLESPQAISNLEEIVRKSDMIMVARGDLTLTCPFELTGILQKKIVKESKRQNKPVIVATQTLDSVLTYYTPQRAEILDLTNSVLDGADGVMLAKETGISETPGYSVEVAKKIITAVETARYLL